MKIYSRMVFDKDNNLIESESHEYTGPVAQCGGSPGPSPTPPAPPPVIAPVTTTIRSGGRALQGTQRGRGVLIQSGTALGAQPTADDIGQKNLLQPQTQVAANILRLMGGGY
jgi:hypothetical protein